MDMIPSEATALGGTNSMLVGVDSNCRHIHVTTSSFSRMALRLFYSQIGNVEI